MGLQLAEVGVQLRLEKDKKKQFLRDDDRRRKEEAMGKLTDFKDNEQTMNNRKK